MSARDPQALFDHRQVRRAFSRAAPGYDAAAALQRAVEAQLLESLDYYRLQHEDAVPARVVDVGSGLGRGAAAMRKRWPKAQVLALDVALPMLREGRQREGWHPLRRGIDRVCADARALPLADGGVDVLFSNLCLQWVEDLPAVFAGFRRVLRPGGLLMVSTFGQDTLFELRTAFAGADAVPHVSPFTTLAQFGDALVHAGFRDPVIDRDLATTHYETLPGLMRELRALGATNALQSRRQTLTGKARFACAADAYAREFGEARGLPATWETITAMAWAPPTGAPIREAGAEIATFPASKIPIRRR
ncbi:MAG: malonyl-[acyl-carrier protein] O-methyltransferase BioC [Lysobacteraceae bacterium]|nr:MAG: malonyl-[acyl-carrier protein] O-methyltransferase BioC [Xanthomonadaceae bacterium]